jgi:hypothetical protein
MSKLPENRINEARREALSKPFHEREHRLERKPRLESGERHCKALAQSLYNGSVAYIMLSQVIGSVAIVLPQIIGNPFLLLAAWRIPQFPQELILVALQRCPKRPGRI